MIWLSHASDPGFPTMRGKGGPRALTGLRAVPSVGAPWAPASSGAPHCDGHSSTTSTTTVRAAVRTFVEREVTPHHERWRDAHQIDSGASGSSAGPRRACSASRSRRSTAAPAVDDFRFNVVLTEEELSHGGPRPGPRASGSTPTWSRRTWRSSRPRTSAGAGCLRFCTGELVAAIAMTEGRRRLGPRGPCAPGSRPHPGGLGGSPRSRRSSPTARAADLILVAARTGEAPREPEPVRRTPPMRPASRAGARCTRSASPRPTRRSCSSRTCRSPRTNLVGEAQRRVRRR